MKNFLILFLIIAFSISMLFMGIGCKEEAMEEEVAEEMEEVPEEKSFEGVTLRIIIEPDPHWVKFEPVVKIWEEKTGAKVEPVLLPGWPEMYEKEMLDFEAGTGTYDIVACQNTWFAANNEYLVDLSEWMSDYGISKDLYFKTAIEDATIGGEILALPYAMQSYSLHYRSDLFEENEIIEPLETYDDMLEAAKKINDPENGVYGWGGMAKAGIFPFWHYHIFLSAMGGKIFNDDGEPDLDNDIALSALDYFQELYKYTDPAAQNYDHLALADSIVRGEAAMTLTHTGWGELYFMLQGESDIQDSMKVQVPPKGEGLDGEMRYGHPAHTWYIAVPKTSKNIEAAQDLIYYLIGTEEAVQNLLESSGWLLGSPAAVTDELRNKLVEIEGTVATLETCIGEPFTPQYMEMAEIIGTELSAVVSGLKSPEEALEAAQTKLINAGVKEIPKI